MKILDRLPVSGRTNQPFGANPTRFLPVGHPTIIEYGNYQPYGHDGLDFPVWTGTPVYAPAAGVVAFSGWGRDMPDAVALKYGFTTVQENKPASGLIVILDHGPAATYCAHMDRTDLDAHTGQRISSGTLLGTSGNTGRSGGPHLHFSLVTLPVNYADPLYSRRNPLDYLKSALTPQITPTQEDTLSAAEVQEIKDHINALVYGGATWDGAERKPLYDVVVENQRRIGAVPDRLGLRLFPVTRNGKKSTRTLDTIIHNLDAGNSNTSAKLAALTIAVEQLANAHGDDGAGVVQAVRDALKNLTITLT